MPNHVDHDLRITGPRADLETFAAFAQETVHGEVRSLSANKFIPYPEEFAKLDAVREAANKRAGRGEITWAEAFAVKDGFNAGGYDWCCKHWGTKWGLYDVVKKPFGKKSTTLRYSFQSAWSPPLPVIRAMAARFPKLTFELHYYERGMGFSGVFCVKGKRVLEESTAKYDGSRGG